MSVKTSSISKYNRDDLEDNDIFKTQMEIQKVQLKLL